MKLRILKRCAFPALLLCAVANAQLGVQLSEPVEPFPPPAARNPDAAATLVVYNQSDTDSADLARFYAEKRGIPKDHLVGLRCSPAEEISRAEYDRTIAEPLRRAMSANGWWKLREPDSVLGPVEANKIRYIALIRGVPLKIKQEANYPGDKQAGPPPLGARNDAAVDSELAVLGFHQLVISGAMINPYHRSFTRIGDFRRPELMLVARLDGPTPSIVRRMIVDTIAAEEEGLAGFAYVDARGLPATEVLVEGDKWLTNTANDARRRGTPVVFDNGPGLFPSGYPMRNAALYFGWYAENVSGSLLTPGFRFTRGAVAVHIHSFSASTVRDPQKNWVAPLLYSGAAATLGNVYEPYLALTPHVDVFHDRLRAGFTFAEASYMSLRALSWQTTVVGDPLYRPFGDTALIGEKPTTGEWAAYRAGAKLWLGGERSLGAAALRAATTQFKSGMIAEGHGLLELSTDNVKGALVLFQQARTLYTHGDDICRVAIHEVIQLRGMKRDADALALARKMIAAHPQSSAVQVLKKFESQMAPAATPLPPLR